MLCIKSTLYGQNKGLEKYYTDSSLIKLIDKNKLKTILQNEEQISVVMIFSNHCVGTTWLLPFANELNNRYKDSVNLILCSCAQPNEFKFLQNLLIKYQVEIKPIYWINSNVYKDKKSDERKKGQLFRNDICESCKEDLIGVPYLIIYKGNKIMEKGFLGRAETRESLQKLLHGS